MYENKIAKAQKLCAEAYKRCEYWERYMDCAYHKKDIINAQRLLTRRQNKLVKLKGLASAI